MHRKLFKFAFPGKLIKERWGSESMSLAGALKNIEQALENVSPETRRKALLEEVAHFQVTRQRLLDYAMKDKDEYLSSSLKKAYRSTLLEEVIRGETTFKKQLEELGPHELTMKNILIFNSGMYIFEDVTYLDQKIAELYHAKK
jgi:hypothetical protein